MCASLLYCEEAFVNVTLKRFPTFNLPSLSQTLAKGVILPNLYYGADSAV